MSLPQKRMLKLKLKIRRRTRAAGKDNLKVFHGLQQGIGVRTDRWRLLAAEPRPHRIQAAAQSAPQPIHRFQRKGQPHLFDGSLEGKPGQQLYQPAPHQWSRQRVPRQNFGQEEDKGAPAAAAPPTVAAKHALAPAGLAVGGVGIIA